MDNKHSASFDSDTRMVAMGSRPLMEGFSLLGFEIWPNASVEDLDRVLTEIIDADQKALILLETYLSRSPLSKLSYVRTNGGRIIVTEVPALNASDQYHPYVEDLVTQVLGSHVLEQK